VEQLFSYGTLRDEKVQRAVFGRTVAGRPDAIVGCRLEPVTITAGESIAISGTADHTILVKTGNDADEISGVQFEITEQDLARADAYEDAAYVRVRVRLRSGTDAWVYAKA
jgi:gamma-glutamylcyclotransferase (GGCT)/AIG2-like uncharacterized protein YtfP